MSMEVPALLARMLGATHVISVHLPMQGAAASPRNMFHVINRCFQILHSRTEDGWRQQADLVIDPDVRGMEWDAFGSGARTHESRRSGRPGGLPKLQAWLPRMRPRRAQPRSHGGLRQIQDLLDGPALLLDLLLQHHERVDQLLRPRRATGHVNVDRESPGSPESARSY